MEKTQIERILSWSLSVEGFSGRSPTQRLGFWRTIALAALVSLCLAGSASAAAPPTGDAGASIATAPPGVVAGSVDSGFTHNCGIRKNGTVACWGDNSVGESTPPAGFG